MGGYGNVIYIRHDDGRRSVYAHLERFIPAIAALMPRVPHRLGGDSSGEPMEVYPRDGVRIRRGQVIAFTGESGAGQPHLHLEVRDSEDRPIHPARTGFWTMEDHVPPVIDGVIIEPADASSTVNGGASPVRVAPNVNGAVVTMTGHCRILVAAADGDGRLGGLLTPRKVTLVIGGRKWSEIRMESFTYGRDRELSRVYDLYRTGFGPTAYVFDLTGPNGAAEVLRGGGVVSTPAEAVPVRIEVEDMVGNKRSMRLSLAPTGVVPRGGAREFAGDAEGINRGGIVVVRDGVEQRAAGVGAGRLADATYEGVAASSVPVGRAMVFFNRVRLLGIQREGIVYALTGSRLAPPAQAVDAPVLLGPFGVALEGAGTVSVSGIRNGNGLARYHNGGWSWIGGSLNRDIVSARLDFLAPIVVVCDTDPPHIEVISDRGLPDLKITDDFSGVDADAVTVSEQVGESWMPVSGRFDSDRDHFAPDEAWGDRPRLLRVQARDHAGNVVSRDVTMAAGDR